MKYSNIKRDEFKGKETLFKTISMGENPSQATNHSNNLVVFAFNFQVGKTKEEQTSGKHKFNS